MATWLAPADPQRRARLLTAGLFGFIPVWFLAMELADPIVHVLEPLYRYAKSHKPTATAFTTQPSWMREAPVLWHQWMARHDYLPWNGWPAVLGHGYVLLSTLAMGLAFGGFVAHQAGKIRHSDWGGPDAAGRGQHGTAHWRSPADLARGYTAWAAPAVPKVVKTRGVPMPATRAQRMLPAGHGDASPVATAIAQQYHAERIREQHTASRSLSASSARPTGLLVGASRMTKPTGGWLLTRDEHALILGSTRSGKTRRLIIPSIFIIGQTAQESLVMTDPKGELYEHTADWLRDQGYRVVRLDLIEPRPGRSQRFNPVQAVSDALTQQDWAKAAALAREIGHLITFGSGAITNTDPLWINGQISLTAALVLAVADRAPQGQRHLGSVYGLLLSAGGVSDEGGEPGEGLDRLFHSFPMGHPARMAYGTVELAQSKTRASILTTTAAGLQIFGDPELVWLTGEADHELGDIGAGDQPTAVFLVIPHDEKSKYMIASLYIAQLFRALTQNARVHHGRLPRRVNFLLDEFGNMPAFPDFDQFVTVSAGMGIRLVIALQNLEQLKKHYRDTERTIRGNLGTWCFLRTSDLQTAEELCKIMGQYTTQTESAQMPKVGWTTVTTNVGHTSQGQSLTGRDLIKPDEIMRWPENQVLTWQAGFPPARLPLPDLSQWALFTPVAERHPFVPPTNLLWTMPAVWYGPSDTDREEPQEQEVYAVTYTPRPDDLMAQLFGDQPEACDWTDTPPGET